MNVLTDFIDAFKLQFADYDKVTFIESQYKYRPDLIIQYNGSTTFNFTLYHQILNSFILTCYNDLDLGLP